MADRTSIRILLVTGLGTGYLPIAPGTWASAATCAVYVAIAWACADLYLLVWGAMAWLAIACTLACGYLGPFIEETFDRKDPGECTLDEWAGQAVALIGLPVGAGWTSPLITASAAFLAFRVFDIFKPPPVDQLEKLPSGWGIVADDLGAGIYANIVCQLIFRFALPAISG